MRAGPRRVNMVTAITLGLAFAFEPRERGSMGRPQRPPAEPLLSRFLVWRIVFVTVLLVAGITGLFLWDLDRGEPLASARSTAVSGGGDGEGCVALHRAAAHGARRRVKAAAKRGQAMDSAYQEVAGLLALSPVIGAIAVRLRGLQGMNVRFGDAGVVRVLAPFTDAAEFAAASIGGQIGKEQKA